MLGLSKMIQVLVLAIAFSVKGMSNADTWCERICGEEFRALDMQLGKMEQRVEKLEKGVEKVCPTGWAKNGKSCYYFGEESITWIEAGRKCRQRGGYLAEIDSIAENEYLAEETRRKGGPHWVGGTDAWKEGEWTWVDSMTKIADSVKDWAPTQPDNKNPQNAVEHCLEINFHLRWNDRSCGYKEKYICEIQL